MVKFTQTSQANFNRAIRDTLKLTNRSAGETVKYAAIKFAQSGRANTPVGKKNRDVVPNTGKGAKWLIIVRRQDRTLMLPTNSKTDPRRNIRMRGAAKNSWNGVFRALGGRTYNAAGGGRGASWGTARKIKMHSFNPSIVVENYTSYMLKAFPALLPTAYNKAAKAMQGVLDRKVSRDFKRLWS